jgi:hypothetical protein
MKPQVFDNHHKDRMVAEVNFIANEAPQLKFPWLPWDFMPLRAVGDPDRWSSDVGTLDGHTLEFKFMGRFHDGFATRCHDVDEGWRDVCGIVMTK